MRRASKVDRNQPEIVGALRAVGASVQPWRCTHCGKEARPTAHQMRKTYCSSACMSAAYKVRMAGEANPNFRSSGKQTCVQCLAEFRSYHKKKFCGQKCYHQSRIVREKRPCQHCGKEYMPNVDGRKYCSVGCVKAAKPRVFDLPKPRPVHLTNCHHCQTEFRSSPSSNRKYCSYKCHLSSGGAKRAGDASTMAKLKYGAKKDANHNEIFDYLNALTAVKDLSNAGCGVPDGVAWVGNGWRLFDVKNPNTGYGRRGLNKRQKSWADDWRGGPVYLIYNLDDAARFARGDFASLKQYPEPEASQDRIGVESYRDLHQRIVGPITDKEAEA